MPLEEEAPLSYEFEGKKLLITECEGIVDAGGNRLGAPSGLFELLR